MKWVGFAVGAALAGYVAHLIYVKGTFDSAAGDKMFGFVPLSKGELGIDDIIAGAAILAAATLGVRILRGVGLPARTSVPV